MYVPPHPDPAFETDVQVSFSRERMEFQSHDWAASVELERRLTLVESLPTATSFLTHTFAFMGGYHVGMQH